jgi:hypothetical protein
VRRRLATLSDRSVRQERPHADAPQQEAVRVQGRGLRQELLRRQVAAEAHREPPQLVDGERGDDDDVAGAGGGLGGRGLAPRLQLHTVRAAADIHHRREEPAAAAVGHRAGQGNIAPERKHPTSIGIEFARSNAPTSTNICFSVANFRPGLFVYRVIIPRESVKILNGPPIQTRVTKSPGDFWRGAARARQCFTDRRRRREFIFVPGPS